MSLMDGRALWLSMRNAVKRVASIPGVTQRSELLARFHWRARFAILPDDDGFIFTAGNDPNLRRL